MTPYERGFMTKCAELDVPVASAISLLKKAAPSPASLWSVLGRAWRPAVGSVTRGAAHVVGGLGDDVTAAALRRYASRQPTAKQLWGEFAGNTGFGRALTGRNVASAMDDFVGPGGPALSDARKQRIAAKLQNANEKGYTGYSALHSNSIAENTGARSFVTNRFKKPLTFLANRERNLMRSIGAANKAGDLAKVEALTDSLKKVRSTISGIQLNLENPESFIHNFLDTAGRGTTRVLEQELSSAISRGDKAMASKLEDILAGKADLSSVGGALRDKVYEHSQAGLDYLREARRTRNARLATGGSAVGVPAVAYALATGESEPNYAARGGHGNSDDYFRFG